MPHSFRPLLAASAFCVGAILLGSDACAREISARDAAAQAQRETNGKVLAVQPLTIGKRKVYRVKVLTPDGQVRIVQISAEQ